MSLEGKSTVNAGSVDSGDENEISLIDLLAVVWHWKFLIIGLTLGCAIFAVVISVISLKLPPEKSFMPNLYTVEADMLINNSSEGVKMSSTMAALASFAGISSSSGGYQYSSLAIFIIGSNSLLDAITDNFNLFERLNLDSDKSPRSSSRSFLKKSLEAKYDDDSGVFSVKFTNKDPEFARDIVNFAVDYLEKDFLALGVDKNILQKKNLEDSVDESFKEITRLQQEIKKVENSVSDIWNAGSAQQVSLKATLLRAELSAQEEIYKQLKTQYELLKIEMANEKPVFQVLERAEIPDRKSKPSRGMYCIILTFAGFFISVFLAFGIEAIMHIRNDEDAMAKLTGKVRAID